MSNWRDQIEDLLSEEIGILAGLIIDEILDELRISEQKMCGKYASKFIKLLEKKTSRDIHDPKLIHQVYKKLLELPY